jgi:hypothetical protein
MYQQVYPPASKPVQSLSLFEKLLKIGRNIPCSAEDSNSGNCSCLGWKPKVKNTGRADMCACGHRVVYHGESGELAPNELDRRVEIAMKIDKVLEAKGKLLDFEYQDEEIKSLRRYIKHIAFIGSLFIVVNIFFYFYRKLVSGSYTATSKPSKRKLEDGEDSAMNTCRLELEEPLSLPEKPAVTEERKGIIEMKVITNSGTMENLMLLTSLKNCIRTQLPNMPAEYITRLVYDK